MKIILLLFIVHILKAQNDTIPNISKLSFDQATSTYELKRKENIDMLQSIDIHTILIDFIPFLVKNDRKIRYIWDKYQNKQIYVYKHLIKYDSINTYQDNAFSFIKNKLSCVDKNFAIQNIKSDQINNIDLSYSNLPCLDAFKYDFVFVDNIIQADFVLSTIKNDYNNPGKQIYIWHIPDLSNSITYLVNAEMPWDVDCFKTKLLSKFPVSINLRLKEVDELSKIRNQRSHF